jgi:hypothetical protein
MKLTKSKLKQIIKEELLNESAKSEFNRMVSDLSKDIVKIKKSFNSDKFGSAGSTAHEIVFLGNELIKLLKAERQKKK